MHEDRQTPILTYCQYVRTLSLYGIFLFIPCSIAFTDICLGVLLLTHIIEILLTRQFVWPKTPFNRPLLAFTLVTLLTTFFAVNVKRSLSDLTNLTDIGVFFLIYLSLRDQKDIKKYTGVLLLSMTLVASYGIIQHYLEVDLFRLTRPVSFLKHVNDDLKAPVRVSGFSSYMTLAGQLAMAIPLICAYVYCIKNRLQQGLWSIILLLNSFALLWTYTRSAWLGAIFAAIVIGSMGKGKKFLLYALCLVLLFFSGNLIFQQFHKAQQKQESKQKSVQKQTDIAQPPKRRGERPAWEFLTRFVSMFRAEDNQERIYTWISTIKMIKDHPFTGIGHGNYSDLCWEYRTPYEDFEFTSDAHAHNNLLQIAVTGGIPLFLCFLWLWWMLFHATYQTYQHIPEHQTALKALSLGIFGALLAFFVQGFFEHNFGDSEVAMMMWSLVAFAVKLQEGEKKTSEVMQPSEVPSHIKTSP